MGFFLRAAMRSAVTVGGVGLAGARAIGTPKTTIDELQKAVASLKEPVPPIPWSALAKKEGEGALRVFARTQVDGLPAREEPKSALDHMAPDHRERLMESLAKKDIEGVLTELKAIPRHLLPWDVKRIVDRPVYSKEDVAQMNAAATALARDVVDRTSRFEKPLARQTNKSVDEKAATLRNALVSLDAKYASLKPEVLRERMREWTVQRYFSNLPTLSKGDLQKVGLDPAQVQNALALKAELTLVAEAEKKARPHGAADRTPSPNRFAIDLTGSEGNRSLTIERGKAGPVGFTVNVNTNLSRLGLNANNFDDKAVGIMNDAINKQEPGRKELLRDVLIVLRTNHKTVAHALVDGARLKGIGPVEFAKGMAQLQEIVRASDSLALTGSDVLQKISNIPQLQALLVLAADEILLAPGTTAANVTNLMDDPKLAERLNAAANSPELMAVINGFGASVDRFRSVFG